MTTCARGVTPRMPIRGVFVAVRASAASGAASAVTLNVPRKFSGPCAPCSGSLDDLVCPREHRLRDRQVDGLGSLEVDDQLELRRLLDGQVGGLGALEDLVDEGRGAPILISMDTSIGHK